MGIHNCNKYLFRWMNTRIIFGLQLSLLLTSHVSHCWDLLTSHLLCLEHWGISSHFHRLSGCTKLINTRAGPSSDHSQASNLEFFPWRPTSTWYLTLCGALWALQESEKRLSKTLAWHHFNYSQVQCRVVPAKATAHLAVLQCCSGRRKF